MMRFPRELYQIEAHITQHLTDLRPAHALGLALWVYGTVLAKSACLTAILIEVVSFLPRNTARQRVREWLKDGRQKARPCDAHVEITPCFPALLRWVVGWWQGSTTLPLAIDAVSHQDRVVALVISVLYRGCAIPVAWHIVPAQERGAWMPHILTLIDHLVPAIPEGWCTLVLADRGLWSPRLWEHVRKHRLHPLVRIADGVAVRPLGRKRTVTPARLVAKPGHGWVGEAEVFGEDARQTATLIVIWGVGHKARWVLLTDLAPRQVQHSWYGMRMWIELGFRALKSMGWQWQKTRRTAPNRVARHWLVLAVATVWVLGCGTHEEDAERLHTTPDRLRVPPDLEAPTGPNEVSLFARGSSAARRQLGRGRLWQRLWLRPGSLPAPYPHIKMTVHRTPKPGHHTNLHPEPGTVP
ncbi:transposase [Candidatus Chloroploca sp. Khr17]|uniref:transposase n=1 Tax=Candidatus Chloroploca sp. Khr17 TaxID=2496869 RepID=UPI00101C1A5E|nr:transposase [Candidatus Chloroploca sp. Khr17]